jgi:hypothetical protein
LPPLAIKERTSQALTVIHFLVALFVLQTSAAPPPLLENDYVRVSKNAAPCAAASAKCGDRILVALSDLARSDAATPMKRGDIAVFKASESYAAPAAGTYLEVAIKPTHPPVKVPAEMIAPEKNSILHDGDSFFIFEEKLGPGETRARHSHGQRLVVVLNRTRLQQWPDGQPEIFKDQIPDDVHFNEPVIHVVKDVGATPLRNIVIELKKGR